MSWTDNKITLKPKMGSTWLIQRLTKPMSFKLAGKEMDNPFSFGGGLKNGGLSDEAMGIIRSIWAFDYMGSSEFEWGIVPATLKFLAEQASKKNLVATEYALDNQESVFIICPIPYLEDVQKVIRQLRADEYKLRLKESCGLKRYFEGKDEWAKKCAGWLEVDNGFLFFADDEMFLKTCQLFGLQIKP